MISASLLVSFHQSWSQVVIIYSILMALWGLMLTARGGALSGGYLGGLVIAEAVIGVQGILGAALVLQGHRPHDNLHFLYGFVTLITIPGAYAYTLGGTVRGSALIMAVACLFLVGISIRAITTGS